MARRVRAEAKLLRRCPFTSSQGIVPSDWRPQVTDGMQQLEVIRQTFDEKPPEPPEPPLPPVDDGIAATVQSLSVPEEALGSEAQDVLAPAAALPLFAQAPSGPVESAAVNAFALLNPPPPWNAVAECRQQAQRLAELEHEIVEECRLRQDRMFRAELQEKQDENEQRWRQQEKDFEAQIVLLERRIIENRLSNQEAEMNMQQDARLRHQVVQERCNVLAVNLTEEQAEFNAKQFQSEQTMSSLRAELIQSQQEMEAVKQQERTLATCGQEEVAAEARCASYVAARAEQRANLAEEEGQKAQEALVIQKIQHQEAAANFQEQRFQFEERLQRFEYQEHISRRLSQTEEEVVARVEAKMERSAAKMLEIEMEKEDLTSSVRALTVEVRACRQEVEQEHEQCQMMKLEVKEAQEKQEGLFVEVQAAQNFAAEATSRAEEEQRERLRDLQDFQRILRQHQNHLDLQQRKEIWEELQDAIHRSGEVSLDVDSEQCDDERVDTEVAETP